MSYFLSILVFIFTKRELEIMKTEYILYFAVVVVILTFMVLFYLLLQDLKKKMVNSKLQKCLHSKIHQKVSVKEVKKMIKYMENNKKHIPFSIYNNSLKTLKTTLLKIH